MGKDTSIQWTDATWNCIRGCSRVSEGCRNCYAESIARRFSGPGLAYEGLVRIDSAGKPHEWNGNIKFVEKHLLDPLKWKEPKRIFVNSMSDLFHENLADEVRDTIFAVMGLCHVRGLNHKFQILTKRPEVALRYYALRSREWAVSHFMPIPGLGDVACDLIRKGMEEAHLGVSCEDQPTADHRIPLLLQTLAAVRFISAEPLLGPIDLLRTPRGGQTWDWLTGERETASEKRTTARLDWVIVGGESGPGARPCDVNWIRGIIEECKAANVPAFVKQLGRYPVESREADGVFIPDYEFHFNDKKGGDIQEWPGDLQVREFPNA